MSFDAINKLLDMQKNEKVALVISRFWNAPKIEVSINADKISLNLGIDDLATALIEEIVNPLKLWTRDSLNLKVRTALVSIVEKTKEASVQAL